MMPVQKMLKQLFLLFSVLQLTVRGYEQSLVKNFTNPPNEGSDLTYQLGSQVVLTWKTDLDRITLQLWDWSGKDHVDLPDATNITNTDSYDWTVGSTANIISNKFFFLIYKAGDKYPEDGSNTFRITDTSTSTTITTSSSSSSTFAVVTTSSSTSTSSAASFASATATPTQSLEPTSSPVVPKPGLSTNAKVGLGVGIGIGIPLLGAIGIYLGWKLHASQQNPGASRKDYDVADAPSNFRAVSHPEPQQLSQVVRYDGMEVR